MKTLGRILIILTVFALIMGITYVAVNAVSASGTAPVFERRGEGPPSPEAEGARPAGGEGRGGGSILRLMFGLVRNAGIVAIIVALVVWLKDFLEKRRRTAQQAAR